MKSPFGLCLVLPIALASPLASAQTAPAGPSAHDRPLDSVLQGPAKDAYVSATILFNNGDFAGAATKYAQAYDLTRDPRLIFNLAICEKNERHYARTQDLLEQYERALGARITADDRAAVDAALAALRHLVGTVRLAVTEAGASVSVDGKSVGTTPLDAPLRLDLGEHALRVKKAGFATRDQTVEVSGGSETALAITLVAEAHGAQLLVLGEEDATVAIDEKTVAQGRFDGRVAPGVSHHDRLFADDHNFASRDVPIRCQCASVSDVAFGSKVYLGSKTTVSGGVTIGDNLVDRNGVVASLDTPANRIAVPFARFATASPDVP